MVLNIFDYNFSNVYNCNYSEVYEGGKYKWKSLENYQ